MLVTLFKFLWSGQGLGEAFGYKDDNLYLIFLVLCLPLGWINRFISGPGPKQFYLGMTGFTITYLMSGTQIFHSVVTIFVSFLLHNLLRGYKHLYLVTFCWSFGYLAFFRASYLLGFSNFSNLANAVQLLLTLRVSSLAADTTELELGPEDKVKLYSGNYSYFLNYQYASWFHRLFQYFSYSYCFLGLFTGPFFRAKTYNDMVYQPNPSRIPFRSAVIKVLWYLPLYTGVYLLLTKLFPFNFVGTEAYYAHEWGVLFRLAYFVPYCVAFRWRFYCAWCISVASCILAGLGAYPKSACSRPGIGPTKLPTDEGDIDYRTVENIEVWPIETSTTIDGPLQHWNMTVQSYFYYYVYRKIGNRMLGRLATFGLSAYWHGLHLGYYIAFFMFMLFITAQYSFIRVTRPLRVKGTEKLWTVVDFVSAWRAYEFSGFAFLLLTPDKILRAWSSVYYIGHIIAGFWILIGLIQLAFDRSMKQRQKED